MSDLGFGLADRRTILAVILTVLLSDALLGFPMPIDTSSVVSFALTFSMFAGFLFAARTLWRVVLALLYFAVKFPGELIGAFRSRSTSDSRFQRFWESTAVALNETFSEALLLPLFVYNDWSWRLTGSRGFLPSNYGALRFLGILDRSLLITLAFLSGHQAMTGLREPGGFAGLALLLLLYVAKGTFTFVLKDSFQRAEEKHTELVSAARRPDIQFPSTVGTYPSGDIDYGAAVSD